LLEAVIFPSAQSNQFQQPQPSRSAYQTPSQNWDGSPQYDSPQMNAQANLFCGKCGTHLSAGSQFCGKCGSAVTGMPQTQFSTPVAEPTGLLGWYLAVLKKYAVFSGRARRKEYWMFFLGNLILGVAFALLEILVFGVDGFLFTHNPISILSLIFGIAVFIPNLAVAVRRLHDTGRSGLWLLWLYLVIPLGATIVFAIFGALLFDAHLAVLALALAGLIGLSLGLLVGTIILLVFTVLDGTQGDNKYGPDPKVSSIP